MKKGSFGSTGRTQRGQAILEGVCALWLMIAVAVAAILLLIGCGTATYYKLKLAYVSNAAARAAVDARFWLGAERPNFNPATTEARVRALVNTMLAQTGLPAATAINIDQSNADVCTVKIRVAGLRIVSGGVLPAAIVMEDTACEPYAQQSPVAMLGIGIRDSRGRGHGIYVPAYGAGVNTPGPTSLPQGKYPYYQIVGADGTNLLGPYQNSIGKLAHMTGGAVNDNPFQGY